MRKTDQKQKNYGGGGRNGGNNGFIPSSFRSLSSYLRIVSSGASTVASTVRSAASAASTIVDRDADAVPDQVLWAGFDKLEREGGISRRLLLLGYQYGFQVWDVEDANNVRNIVSRYDGPVFFMQVLPKPDVSNHTRVEYPNDRPLLVICADGSFAAGANALAGPAVSSNGNVKNNHDQINGGYGPTVVWFYSLKSHAYIKELKFRSAVYSVRCSSRVVAVLQAAQVHCFDVATLEREYTILTNRISTTSSWFENIGLGPLAVGPRWIAYSGSCVALPSTRVSPQHLTHSKTFTSSGSNGSIVAHYAKQSSKQLAAGIVTLGDIGYKTLSQHLSDAGWKDRGNPNGHLSDTENVGMVIVKDVVSKSVIAQFKAHDSPIASLCFDPSGTLLVTASVHGHNFNVFRIIPGATNDASYIHLYKLQRGFTNAVIQDISFSVDSRWITLSSSRGTSHLFNISPSWTPNYDGTNKPPVTLSAVSRIRSGNSGWRNVVTGAAAVAASSKMNSYSGVIASTFHRCKVGSTMSTYHMLVFSSSGCVIQYALRLPSAADIDDIEPLSPDNDSKLVVEPIQKWNICNKQNRREREENIDIYGENGHMDNRKVFPERTGNGNGDYFEGLSKIKKENEGKNHVYISEVELHTHQVRPPIWARPQIKFQSLTIDDIYVDGVNNSKGEFEMETIPTRTIEARSKYLVPAVDYLRVPKVQTPRVPTLDYNKNGLHEHEKLFKNGSSFDPVTDENDNEETGEDGGAGPTPMGDFKGFVNSDISPTSHTPLETVDNREHSVSGTQSELVNNNIHQKHENQFEDQGIDFY